MMPSLMNAGRSRGDGAHGVRLRLVILQVVVLSLIVALFGRLWFLQIRDGQQYTAAASQNGVREIVTPAVRGQILDDTGQPLVDNRTALVVTVDRTALSKQPNNGDAVLTKLANVLGVAPDDMRNRVRLCDKNTPKPCWNGSPYQPIPVSENATTEQALTIMEHQEDFPGVTAQPSAVRQYPAPDGANAAQILGYLSPVTDDELNAQKQQGKNTLQRSDLVGRSGLERSYDTDLRGQTGVTQLGVDNLGRVTGVVGETPATPGNDVVTSIDARIQAVAEQQLQAALDRAHSTYDKITHKNYVGDSGSVVVMDVHTGRIVAMASAPTYDPNVWTGGISAKDYAALTDPNANVPLMARATQAQFAPGSTFKVVSTSATGMDGYSLKANYDCPTSVSIGGQTFGNYESESFGPITLKKALEVSCDTVFYGIAYDMWLKDGGINAKNPKDPMVTMAKAFGLGQPTGIDLPGEAGGRIADRDWKKAYWEANKDAWCKQAKSGATDYATQIAKENCVDGWQFRAGDAANFAIGQGDTLVTPLQLARVYAAVANGGTLYQPEIAKAIVSPDGKVVREIQPKAVGSIPVNKATLSYIQDALVGVSTEGTAAGVFGGSWPMSQLPVAAKTGTGEVYGKQTTSVFATYAPANNPQYAVVMMVSQGGTGSGTSGPSVRKIYQSLLGVDDTGKIVPGTAVLPNPPTALPQIRPDGTVAPVSYILPDLPGTDPAKGGATGPTVAMAQAAAGLPPDRVVYRTGRLL